MTPICAGPNPVFGITFICRYPEKDRKNRSNSIHWKTLDTGARPIDFSSGPAVRPA